jgi:hypothetical protein
VVALELLHLAPLSCLLHRPDFRVCDECLVSLVEPGVVWHLEFGVRLRRGHRHGLRRLWMWWLHRCWRRAVVPA